MSKKVSKLRLYVWENVLADYTSGIMFALATSVEEAREVILKEEDVPEHLRRPGGSQVWNELQSEPMVFDQPVGFAVWGGG